MKVCAIIPAGGIGKRMGGKSPKQFMLLGGIPVLVHTLRIFERASTVDRVVLVAPEGDIAATAELAAAHGCKKVAKIVPGGRERQDSVLNGLAAVGDACDIVAIHDAVRPFINEALVDTAVSGAAGLGAVCVGMPVKDTIKQLGPDDRAAATLNRKSLWIAQTPQVFKREILEEAYRRAYADGYYGTDDASLVERIGVPVAMIRGGYGNIKITTPEDLEYGEYLLQKGREAMRTGTGYDSHRLVEGRKLILGGVEIPFERGLAGHSDADALIHAVIDALLGAMGQGDIGKHFPDTNPVYKGISSLKLLDQIKALLAEMRFSILNIDAGIILERPKLAPFTDSMRENIARSLDIPAALVNIKAKTNEGMGFVGRGEGVAVFATATIVAHK